MFEQRLRALEDQFRKMLLTINDILTKIANLDKCCCENKMFYITIDGIFWYNTEGEINLNLQDRLPVDGVCNEAKAIALTEDATLYLMYTDTDGWIVYMSSYGGKSICCN